MTTLRLICRQQEAFEHALHRQIELFQLENPDVRIQCEFLPIHEHFEKMVEGDSALSGDYDLFLCCTDWLPKVIADEKIISITPYIDESPPQDWPNGWHKSMRKLVVQDEQVFGLPWHDGPEVLHYRGDLFENENEKRNFLRTYGRELEPPRTWDEFIEVAQFFTRRDQGLWGCCQAAYTDGHNNVYDFLIQLWSRGGSLLDSGLNPRFYEKPGQDALQFLIDLFHRYKVAPLECLELGSVECGDYYAQGHAAMSWNWIGFAATCELPTSRIIGSNRCTRIPAGSGRRGKSVSLNIYWALTIPSGSKNRSLAYQFLQFVSRPENDKLTSLSGANGTRLSTWRDPEIQCQFAYYKVIESIHESTRTLPAIPEYAAINEIISHAVHKAVHLGWPSFDVLESASREVHALMFNSI